MTAMKRFIPVLLAALPLMAATPKPKAALFQATATAAHKVTLTWVASSDASSSNPVTYDVLRASGACASGQTFAAVASGVSAVTYTDTSVVGGQTYCYEVESVGVNGAVSGPSNTAAGAVPPFPPSGASASAQ